MDELPRQNGFLDGSRCEVTLSGGVSCHAAGHVTCDPSQELVLSTFPGIDLLGRGFENVGFPVVLGPDLLWDRRIEDFHVPAGRFTGIIGGPPCQNYSDANRTRNPAEGDRLVRHYLRIVAESQCEWFVMENVRNVPDVAVPGYTVQRLDITDAACGGKQRRLRHIQFGSRAGQIIRPARTEGARSVTPAVLTRLASKHDRHSRRLARQSAPRLTLKALTSAARARGIGNAVPWLVAVTLAQAVAVRGPVTPSDCICGCGRATKNGARHAGPACRKRMERRRKGLGRVVSWDPASAGVAMPSEP